MVPGSNEQHSQHYGQDNQDMWQVMAMVERQHQRKKKDGEAKDMETMEHRGGCLGEGRAPGVYPAVEEKNLE